MANKVFANGREVACKAGAGKATAAFPSVCMTPPQTPATPPGVPIPYPNNTQAGDSDKGTKKVKISGKEVTVKAANFKKSTGDEAGSAPMKCVVTQTNKGKGHFVSSSMDVKIEGEDAVRHLDMETNNHQAEAPGATPPWPFMDTQTSGSESKCTGEKAKEEAACKEYAPNKGKPSACAAAGLAGPVIQKNAQARAISGKKYNKASDWADDMSKQANANDCVKARRCKLVPYDGEPDGVNGCCPSQTPDHLIPASSFFSGSRRSGVMDPAWKAAGYDPAKAPCMCSEGASNHAGSHGLRHAHHKALGIKKDTPRTFNEEAKACAEGAAEVFAASGCSAACIEEQLKNGHPGGANKPKVKHSPSGKKLEDAEITAKAEDLGTQIPKAAIK